MVNLVVEVVALAAIFWFEWLFPLFEGRRQRVHHAFRNIGLGVLNALCISLSFSTVTVWVTRWSKRNSVGLLHSVMVFPPFLKGLFAFVLFDFWMYAWHIVSHHLRFLWRFHRVHHTDLEVDSTTALRFHAVEVLISSLVRLAVLLVLGIEWRDLLIYELVLQPLMILHHGNIAFPEKWDRVLRAIIVTPNMHRIHHSQERFETNSNYASVFSFWDRIGKTFQKRENLKTLCYGLPEFSAKGSAVQGMDWQSFWGMLKIPFAWTAESLMPGLNAKSQK